MKSAIYNLQFYLWGKYSKLTMKIQRGSQDFLNFSFDFLQYLLIIRDNVFQ